jgi:hypothetical protein
MKPGKVVRFRMSPTDCLSVLDIMKVAKISTDGKSFNTVVHLALSSMLESYRKAGIINADPDPFSFMPRMEEFTVRDRQKLAVTNALTMHEMAGNRVVAAANVVTAKDLEQVKRRLAELDSRSDNLSEDERLEYDRLCAIVFN